MLAFDLHFHVISPFSAATKHWSQQNPPPARVNTTLAVHKYNWLLWQKEDLARDPSAADTVIAATKRQIDELNQLRHNSIDAFNREFAVQLADAHVVLHPRCRMPTESFGSAVDRLSILTLRLHALRQLATDNVEGCDAKLNKAIESYIYLMDATQALVNDLYAGKAIHITSGALKLYNDPATNQHLRQQDT